MKTIGYFVVEHSDEHDFEQVLGIQKRNDQPKGGVLVWAENVRAMFPTRKAARECIERTEHYRKAFGYKDMPEKKNCTIYPVIDAEA